MLLIETLRIYCVILKDNSHPNLTHPNIFYTTSTLDLRVYNFNYIFKRLNFIRVYNFRAELLNDDGKFLARGPN